MLLEFHSKIKNQSSKIFSVRKLFRPFHIKLITKPSVMITNLPNYDDFEKVAKECFIQAFELFFKIYTNYREYNDNDLYEEVPLNEVWEHNKATLRTSIILLHQGIETYMKGIVVRSSPYLLLEQKKI